MTAKRKLWALSIVLSFLTFVLMRGLALLPYSEVRDRAIDTLTLPGAIAARVFFPEGVHTGSGSPEWPAVAFGSNVAFYLLLWFAVLYAFDRYRSRPMVHE